MWVSADEHGVIRKVTHGRPLRPRGAGQRVDFVGLDGENECRTAFSTGLHLIDF